MALVRVSRQCQLVSIKSDEADIIFRKHLVAYNFTRMNKKRNASKDKFKKIIYIK